MLTSLKNDIVICINIFWNNQCQFNMLINNNFACALDGNWLCEMKETSF